MAAISETLRQARLRSGADLDKLAAATKINPRYLRAIESGEFDKLPGGIFARMFVKQYADALGLDGAAFAEEFQRSSQFGNYAAPDVRSIAETRSSFHPNVRGLSSAGERVRDERLTSALSSLIWVVAAIGVCAAAYYGLAPLPARSGSAHDSTVTNAAPAPAPTSTPAPSPAKEPAAQPQTTTPAPQPAAAPAPTPAPAPAATGPIQLVLNAIEPVWVTAIADGKTVLAEVVPAGSSKTIVASKGARLTLGNAGGVDITFNGKKLEPFGPRGQVRTVDFTSWGAQVVSRTPTPDPLR